MSKCFNSTMFLTSVFSCWNAFSHSDVHANSLFWLNNGRNGALTSASFGRNLCKLCIDLINDLSCFLVLGGFKLSTSWVFLTNDEMPFFPTLQPNHSHSVFANSLFRNFNEAFDSSSFFKFFSTNAMCLIYVHFDAISMSSIKVLAWGNSLSKLSMAFGTPPAAYVKSNVVKYTSPAFRSAIIWLILSTNLSIFGILYLFLCTCLLSSLDSNANFILPTDWHPISFFSVPVLTTQRIRRVLSRLDFSLF